MSEPFSTIAQRRASDQRRAADSSRRASGVLVWPRTRPACTGVVYISGVLQPGNYMSDPSKGWIVVSKRTHSARQDSAPPSPLLPEAEEWYRKATTYGDIRVEGW